MVPDELLCAPGLCYKGKGDRRIIEVNQRSNTFRAKAKERLTSEEGLYHRRRRPFEPEAVFGDIKFDHGFKRFRLKGNEKVNVEFGLVALAHNLRKNARVTCETNAALCRWGGDGVSGGLSTPGQVEATEKPL